MKTKKQFTKRILSIFLSIVMLLSLVPSFSLTAFAADAVSYIERSWNGTEVVSETKTVTDYNVVTSSTTTMSNGWYVVNSDVTVASRIKVTGTVNLILADGYTLTASQGVEVNDGNTLNIYGQSADTGAIRATGSSYSAGIGGNMSKSSGTIIIHGGSVTASGGTNAAGIGGGQKEAGGTTTIYGGVIEATGSNTYFWNGAAGIGGGTTNDNALSGQASGDIDIYGGIIFATGKNDADDIGGGIVNTSLGGYKKGSKDVTILGGLIFDRYGNGTIGGTSYTLEKNWEIPSGKTLTIESGKTLIIPKGVTLTTTGTLVNNGAIVIDCTDTTTYSGTILNSHSDLTYVADDENNTITATCGNDNTHVYTITLAADASTVTYDGGEHGATVQDTDNNWANASLTIPTISYAKKQADTSWGTPTTDKPKDAGEYQASITVDTDKTVSVEYTIEKADAEVPTDLTATYGQKLSDIDLPTDWSWATPSDNVGNVGTQTHKANYAGNDNYNAKNDIDITVKVSPAEAEMTASTDKESYTYGETIKVTVTVAPKATTSRLRMATPTADQVAIFDAEC